MGRCTIRLQTLLLLVFFTGIRVQARVERESHSLDRCFELAKEIGNNLLDISCPDSMRNFFTCTNNVLIDKFGFDWKEMASLSYLDGNELDKFSLFFAYLHNLYEGICREGTPPYRDYVIQCFRSDSMLQSYKYCKQRAVDVFKELEAERIGRMPILRECATSAYELGCFGVAIHKECGEEAFDRYKNIIKKRGLLQKRKCYPFFMPRLKTTFIEGLNMSDSYQKLYREVFDMKKKRK